MKSAGFGKVTATIVTNKKKGKFDFSHDVNTTYDWGEVQPLACQLMQPDSSINVNLEQLTRLAPMVVPTFGRVKLKNVSHFVPMTEIFPNWDYFQAQQNVTRGTETGVVTFRPTEVPHVNSSLLTMHVLAGAKANIYVSGAVGTDQENSWYLVRNEGTWNNPSDPWINAVREYGATLLGLSNSQTTNDDQIASIGYTGKIWNLVRLTRGSANLGTAVPLGGRYALPTITTMVPEPLVIGNGYTHSFSNEQNSYDSNEPFDPVTMEGADLIWESSLITSVDRSSTTSIFNGITSDAFDGCKVRICFKLSSFGKRLSKVLVGLGYNVSLVDDSEVSILPLLAYYKAWWDSYAPKRTQNFYMTNAWKLIEFCEEGNANCNLTQYFIGASSASVYNIFKAFIADVGNAFATERVDAVSAATENVLGDNAQEVASIYNTINDVLLADAHQNSFVNPDQLTSHLGNPDQGGEPVIRITAAMSQLTAPQLEALKRAYVYINKYSVAGKAIAEILRMNGLGKYVDECAGRFIDANEDSIKISDVVATAQTNADNQADSVKLGQYGGRGLGLAEKQFSFSTDKHGYLIVLSSIVPEAGYVNAPDLTLEDVTKDSMFQGQFDGLGYEALPKKILGGSHVLSTGLSTGNDTFGFLPTFSRYKFVSNKANGDFRLNSMRASLRPYTLDKYIPINEANPYYTADVVGTGTREVTVCTRNYGYGDLPNAGEDWRYVNKYCWNGDFNRIFAAEDDGVEWIGVYPNNNAHLFNSFSYDNFLTHNVFQITYWAPMKPIEDSYGTIDECDDKNQGGIARS